MWLASLAQIVLLSSLSAQGAAAQAAPSQPIFTRQTTFTIPYRLGKATNPREDPAEVHLYVSTDRGVRWQLYNKVAPHAGQFTFRAAVDGEYWFAVRTVDRSGKMHSPRSDGPELRVVVDTTIPSLGLTALRGPGGEVTARWQVNESHLKPGSLKIQYRANPRDFWQSVALDRATQNGATAQRSGEVTWWPLAGAAELQIRAEIVDAAGNTAVSHTQVQMEPSRPAVSSGDGGATAPALPAASVESLSAGPLLASPTGPGAPTGSRPSAGPASPVATVSPPQSAAPVTQNSLPQGQRVRMVNSCVFELAFDVASVGPSNVARVVLWATRDSGRTWVRQTITDGPSGPTLVKVDADGLWGFRLLMETGATPPGQSPRSGENPDAWVGVDTSKPACRFVSIRQGAGELADRVAIAWQASDNLLGDRPITILVSDQATGPWTPVGNALANSGHFNWTLDGRTPPSVFFRLEVRDEAGNVGLCETPEPLTLQPIRPAVYVHGVHPVDVSAGVPFPLR